MHKFNIVTNIQLIFCIAANFPVVGPCQNHGDQNEGSK